MSDYFTTDELAEFLRVKPRKVYDLVSKEEVPFSRVMGKLLFSKEEVANFSEAVSACNEAVSVANVLCFCCKEAVSAFSRSVVPSSDAVDIDNCVVWDSNEAVATDNCVV